MVVAVSRPSISFSQNSAQRETGWPAADQLGSNRAVGKTEPLDKRVRPAETLLADAPLYKRAASQAFLGLHRYLQQQHYRGYEFDDFLASPVARLLSLNSLFLRRVAVQVGELLPLNVRPLLGIGKLESAKARGFFAKGYLYRFLSTGHESWLSTAVSCIDWLPENSSHGRSQHQHPIFAEVRDLVRQPELLRRLNLQEVSCESNSHQNIPLPVEPTMGTASSAQSGGRN